MSKMDDYYCFWEKFFNDISDEDLDLIAPLINYKPSYAAKEIASMFADEYNYRHKKAFENGDPEDNPNYPNEPILL